MWSGVVEWASPASYPARMESARVVLVTNVGQGFGRAVALAYGRAGYDVVCADRDVEMAAKTAAELEELGGQAIPIQADMTTQMDVVSAYHKVMEIFGALGGVVHLASQISSTPFEDLAEGEFYELIAENVRSSYLALKTASRLLNAGWIVLVAPPTGNSVQMHAVQGALREMVVGFQKRFAYPRANLVLPSRAPSDPRHDQALVRAVRFLGSPEAAGVSGQVIDVELPIPPRISDSLLPEVRAALDPTVRQIDDDAAWIASDDTFGEPDFDETEDDREVADREQDEIAHYGDGVRLRHGAAHEATAQRRYPASSSASSEGGDDQPRVATESGVPDSFDYRLPDEAFDDLDGEFEDDHEDWALDLGLPGSPSLRHLVADEEGPTLESDGYAAGHEPARDLYGDLRRLDLNSDGEGAEERHIPLPRRRN